MRIMPRAVPCAWVSSRRTTVESRMKVYIWLVKTLHNLLFWALSGSLAQLTSFVHWLRCFHFLNVANRQLHSALNSAKHVRCGGQAGLSSASSIVKKRRSSLHSTSLVPRPHQKNQERGLVTLANYLICAESAYYVTIMCLLWSCGSQLLLTMALQSRWADLATEQPQGNPVRQE